MKDNKDSSLSEQGKRLKAVRKGLGLTQAELQEKLGMGEKDKNGTTVSKYEAGALAISASSRLALYTKMGVSEAFIERGELPMFTDQKETPTSAGADPLIIIAEILKESREDRRMLMANQSMINQTAQAAIQAAQAATALAQKADSRFEMIEQNIVALSTMTEGLQVFVADRFAEIQGRPRQEIDAALGTAVLNAAKKKKTGTRSAVGT